MIKSDVKSRNIALRCELGNGPIYGNPLIFPPLLQYNRPWRKLKLRFSIIYT